MRVQIAHIVRCALRLTGTVTKSVRSARIVLTVLSVGFYPWGGGCGHVIFYHWPDYKSIRVVYVLHVARISPPLPVAYRRTIRNSAPSSSLPCLNSWRFGCFTQQVARRRKERRLQNRRRSHDVRVPKLHTHSAASVYTVKLPQSYNTHRAILPYIDKANKRFSKN